MKKVILYLMVFGISFVAFSKINFNRQEELVGDVNEYIFDFKEVTIKNEKIVVLDNRQLADIHYYVVEFFGNQYVVYSYYFMSNREAYLEKYSEYASCMVDYDYDQYMIKVLDYIDYGTYNDVMNKLNDSLESNALYIIY